MTELERTLAAALRDRAGSVPQTPMPRLGRTPARSRRLLPVAAAIVAAAGIAGGVVALSPDDQGTPPPADSVVPDPYVMRDGEVYYLRIVGSGRGTRYAETELWQSAQTTGPWRTRTVTGNRIEHGRVVPAGEQPAGTQGTCYPSRTRRDALCRQPSSWADHQTLAFLSAVPVTREALSRQLRAEALDTAAAQVVDGVVGAGSTANVAAIELSFIQEALSGNGVSPALRSALRQVVAALPGVEVRADVADRLGRRGTGYRVDGRDYLIFDGDTYLGTPSEAVIHGVAPAPGADPSRLLG
jgi:hypothetical protein